jgi:hypothetical protein
VKLATAQAVLGLILTLAACIIAGWMMFGAPSQLNLPVPAEGNGPVVRDNVVPNHQALFTAARYLSGLLLGLGLAVLAFGIIQRQGGRRTGLAVVQTAFGFSIAGTAVFVTTWGYPTQFTIPGPEGGDVLGTLNVLPGPPETTVALLTFAATLLGIAVLGVGIAQFIGAGRESI